MNYQLLAMCYTIQPAPNTSDNGKEFAQFKRLEEKTGLFIYFADPYSAWQQGSNENTNGLIRQYLPKGTNFKSISDIDLAQMVFLDSPINAYPA